MSYSNSEYTSKLMSAEEAVRLIKSGDRVWCGFSNSFAYALMDALWNRRDELEDILIGSSQNLIPTPLLTGTEPNPFRILSSFIGPQERLAKMNGRKVDFTSLHLHTIDTWFSDTMRTTVGLLSCTEPDENGYVNFGPSGSSINKYVVETADRIILQVNRNLPRIRGIDTDMHISKAAAIVEQDEELPTLPEAGTDDLTMEISRHILPLIPDAATIQLGIGGLSTAIGYGLKEKNDLGIYTEMLTDSMLELIRNGNVTNRKKGFHDGKSVYSFALGSKELYRAIDCNDDFMGCTFPYVNDPRNIMKNRRMISINAAMAVDIYGQVAADSLGGTQHSAIGGQVDFVRGAQWSEEGKSIIALASCFMKNGKRISKISLDLPMGTAVSTSRADVQYIATEYGCINLHPLNSADRTRAMISLAHPDFRDELTEGAKKRGLI